MIQRAATKILLGNVAEFLTSTGLMAQQQGEAFENIKINMSNSREIVTYFRALSEEVSDISVVYHKLYFEPAITKSINKVELAEFQKQNR